MYVYVYVDIYWADFAASYDVLAKIFDDERARLCVLIFGTGNFEIPKFWFCFSS